ncbi:MAG: ubiquitin-conjugating enzyme E2, partial [Singulisphaera sp.]
MQNGDHLIVYPSRRRLTAPAPGGPLPLRSPHRAPGRGGDRRDMPLEFLRVAPDPPPGRTRRAGAAGREPPRFRTAGQPAQLPVEFRGLSLARERGKVIVQDRHEVEVKLGVSYPRTMPELRWITPIYHPNISEIGLVCLGGYGTHWVPSLHLDELCTMLWDMARYFTDDIRSPYNREA